MPINAAERPARAKAVKTNRGFTLIELMIVIAIVGILASVAMPSYRSYVMKSNVAAGVSMMQGVKTEIMEEYNLTGSFPAARIDYFVDSAGSAAKVERIIWQPSWDSLEVWFGTEAGGELSGKIVMMKPDVSNPTLIKWVCSNHPSSSRQVPADSLPGDCAQSWS